jgi:hypothetical protein
MNKVWHYDQQLIARPNQDYQEIKLLLAGGLSIGEAVLPETTPPAIEKLELFK